jgi:hypothetical protein
VANQRSPGDPIHPKLVSGVQEALPVNNINTYSQVMHVGNGQYYMNTPTTIPMQVDHAQYKSSDVPPRKLSTDYKP